MNKQPNLLASRQTPNLQAHQGKPNLQAHPITSGDSFTRSKIFSDWLFRAPKELDELSIESNKRLDRDDREELPDGKVLALCSNVRKNHNLMIIEGVNDGRALAAV
jgi:hypothetical protein